MDPINIIVGVNLIVTMTANYSGAKKGLRSKVTPAKDKPKTYLQNFPLLLATITLIFIILAVFQVGTFVYLSELKNIRIAGLLLHLCFSWIQIWSFKTLGENYSQEILIYKSHVLIKSGPYKYIRHPHYLSQMLSDTGAGIATLGYIVIPLALIEIPFLIKRALIEDALLFKNFGEDFLNYKKKSGFMIPFIG